MRGGVVAVAVATAVASAVLLWRAVVELLLQLALAFERGQHERVPVVVGVGGLVEPLQDDVAQGRVRHDSSDLPCPEWQLSSGH